MPHHGRTFHDPSMLPQRPLRNPQYHLLNSLTYILINYPPTQRNQYKFSGLYNGPTSIAYLFLRLSHIYPELTIERRTCLGWCAEYLSLKPSASQRTMKVSPSKCGIGVEELVRTAVQACALLDEELAVEVCRMSELVLAEPEEDDDMGSDEWLYGRAGYLYLLRIMKNSFPKDNSNVRNAIDRTVESTIDRMMQTLREKERWTWHGKEYFGAVHGTIGIITQIVLSSSPHPPPAELEAVLEKVLDRQLPSGNWPSSRGSYSDRLVQVCHGAPGFVISLMSLAPYFPQLSPRIHDAITKAQQDIFQRGLLTKDPCLCHGATGNALALLDTERMKFFLGYTTRDFLEEEQEDEWWKDGMFTRGDEDGPDEEMGLWTGEAGRAWGFVVAEMLEEGRKEWKGKVIGYNDF
ncbi:hypothetical protein BDZ91DRAFT_187041 [Kalaharituber pfeilii]|nr:hypothetical protein BDZ91DRAFT_187041 [Kalaharituber pfeilii]